MTVSNIYKLLDKLEMMVLKGIPVPLTPWVFVNHEKIIDSLDKIRASIPGEIQEAVGIIKRSEDLQMEAQKRASQVLTDAQQRAEFMLSDSELLRAVQAEAERIRQQVITDCEHMRLQAIEESEAIRTNAINEAIQIREGSDKYAESVLTNLNTDLTEIQSIVQNGQKHLAKLRSEAIANLNAQKNKAQAQGGFTSVQQLLGHKNQK